MAGPLSLPIARGGQTGDGWLDSSHLNRGGPSVQPLGQPDPGMPMRTGACA